MKKVLENAGVLLSYIILTPILILVGIGLALYLPVDYVRYRRSAFYQDTGHRYELFSGGIPWIRLYNAMRKENLPLDFYLHTSDELTYGYFRYQNILLVQDYSVEYEPKKQEWFVYFEEDDEDICTTVAEMLGTSVESYNEIVGEKLCDRAVLLVDRSEIPEADLPHLDRCDLLLGYNGKDGLVPALKQWIERKRG